MSQAKVMPVNSRRAILFAVFVGVHLPLLGLIALFSIVESPSVLTTLSVALGATVLAAVATLSYIWREWPRTATA